MPNTLSVLSPVGGVVVPLEQVPDPVFNQRMLGDGLAIDPAENILLAPFDGKVTVLNKSLHALALRKDDFEILIHIGLETVALNGKGFKAFIREGEDVKQGQKLLEFDRDFIRQNAPSSLVIVVVTQPQDTKINAVSGTVKTGDKLFVLGADPAAVPGADLTQGISSSPITITDPNGLHARPAGLLANKARNYPFTLTMQKNGQTADVKSVVGMMSLAVRQNDRVTLTAHTQDEAAAQEALSALTALLSTPTPADDKPQQAVGSQPLCACPGLAQGPAFQWVTDTLSFEENAADAQTENARFQTALKTLEQNIRQAISSANADTKAILQAHLEILADPLLLESTCAAIARGKTAQYAFNEAVRESIDLLKNTGVNVLAERMADLKDLRRRMLNLLNGNTVQPVQAPQGSIIIAQELLPSDLAAVTQAAGIMMTEGSPTAHISIMLRNTGIPTLVRAPQDARLIPNGTTVLLDATNARFTAAPNPADLQAFTARLTEQTQKAALARQTAATPALTQDGVQIAVSGNINSPEQAAAAFENGADGLGLVRTEFLFINHQNPPSLEEQTDTYRRIVKAMQGKPVTLRTLDAGGDKPLPFLHQTKEENPIVGRRGIRLYQENEELFLTQICAMLRAAQDGPVRIMIPMIGFVEELRYCQTLIQTQKKKLGITADVPVGMMTEVPSAALMAQVFAREADFFSLGTNDLTQYTLAIDRGHPALSTQADGLNPAVLQLIALTCRGAEQHRRETAVCGALAAEPEAIPLLIGLGVRELAVGAGAVAQTKAFIRTLSVQQCQAAAQHALTLASAAEVRSYVRQTFLI